MDETWQRIVQQIRDLPAYIALLRSHELATRIVSALDCRPQGSSDQAGVQDTDAIISLLLQMIESKWSLGFVSPDHQRLLDYAHDWASETLLTLVATSDGNTQASTPPLSEALEAMGRELFVYRSETESDRLQEIERSIEDALATAGANLSASDVTDVLEACADRIRDDERFVELVESVVMASSRPPRVLPAMGASFKARLLKTEQGKIRLLDALSIQTRLRVWESDLELWTEQLDQWLVRVHAEPFASVSAITGLPFSGFRAPSSPLYVALIVWASTAQRRIWLRAIRSRELVNAVSQLLRNDESDSEAFSRRLLAKVPRAMSQKPSHQWPLKQRAFVLRCVAQGLPTSATNNHSQWLEFLGLVERFEIVQHALDSLVTFSAKEDMAETEKAHAVQVFAWFEACVYATGGAEAKDTLVVKEIHGLAEVLGRLPVSRDGVQWLLEQRSSTFATLTVTKLRITWRWLLKAIFSASPGSQPEVEDVRGILESIEYIIRRHAPATDSRPFQIEVIALFLNDLEWCGAHHEGDRDQKEAADVVKAWIVKLVRLLPQEANENDHKTNLSQQLDHRISIIGL